MSQIITYMEFQRIYALVLGFVLITLSLIGFYNNNFYGITTNTPHNIIYLIFGLLGVYSGSRGKGSGYNTFTGYIFVLFGIFGFVKGFREILIEYLNNSFVDSYLHLAIGIISLLVFYIAKK